MVYLIHDEKYIMDVNFSPSQNHREKLTTKHSQPFAKTNLNHETHEKREKVLQTAFYFVYFVVNKMKRIAVFCGSNKGARPEYAEAAERARRIARARKNRAGLWRRHGRIDGHCGGRGVEERRPRHRRDSAVARHQGGRPRKIARPARGEKHARAQGAHRRTVRRLHRAAYGFIACPAATARSRNFARCWRGASLAITGNRSACSTRRDFTAGCWNFSTTPRAKASSGPNTANW